MHDEVILKVRNLKQHFKTGVGKYKIYNKAVDGVSFDIRRGEVFSLVGESGCGKTTTGRTIIKIYKPTDGSVELLGKRIVAGTLGYKQEIKKLKAEKPEKIKEIQNDTRLSDDKKKEKVDELKKATSDRIKEIRKEIRSAKKEKKEKNSPDEEE